MAIVLVLFGHALWSLPEAVDQITLASDRIAADRKLAPAATQPKLTIFLAAFDTFIVPITLPTIVSNLDPKFSLVEIIVSWRVLLRSMPSTSKQWPPEEVAMQGLEGEVVM